MSSSLAVSAGRLRNGECDEMMLKQVLKPKRRMNSLSIATLCERSSVVRMKSRGIGAAQKRGRLNVSSAGPIGSGVRCSNAQT